MLIMHTVESTVAEVTFHGRAKLARVLRLDMDWVRVHWDNVSGKGLVPRIDVVDPSLDLHYTAEQLGQLPPLRTKLEDYGIKEPEKYLQAAAVWMCQELVHRLEAFT